MGEILNFDTRKTTAEGRFFMAVEEQEEERMRSRHSSGSVSRKPTQQQSVHAARRLQFIFSGENKQQAEELYQEGLADVVAGPRDKVGWHPEPGYERFGIEIYYPRYSAAALFYMHVAQLADIANHAYDCMPESPGSTEPTE